MSQTKQQVIDKLFSHLEMMMQYWESEVKRERTSADPRNIMERILFSFLVHLDGFSSETNPFLLAEEKNNHNVKLKNQIAMDLHDRFFPFLHRNDPKWQNTEHLRETLKLYGYLKEK